MYTASKDVILALKTQKISQTPINKGDLKDFTCPKALHRTDWQAFRLWIPDFPEIFPEIKIMG